MNTQTFVPAEKTKVRQVTIVDIARATGLSKSTVSYALNGRDSIPLRTREIVEAAARELGYAPNPHARRLAGGRLDNVVAFYSPALEPGLTISKAQHIQNLLNQRGFDVELHAHPYEAEGITDRGRLLRRVRAERPCAILCHVGWNFGGSELEELQQFLREGGQVVCLSYERPAAICCDQVIFDGLHSLRLAVQHLRELGHKAIGLGAAHLSAHDSRRVYFSDVIQHAGAYVKDEWFLDTELNFFERSGAVLAEKFLLLKERPTAMVIINDVAASAFINMVQRSGCQVPEHVGVVGLDNTDAAEFAAVAMTTVSQPYKQWGDRVVQLLLDRLEGYKGEPRHEIIRGELVVRNSTATLIS